MSSSLQNYIRTLRKRVGLSQEELGFLLGGIKDSTVARHEVLSRQPDLETALLYAAVLRVDPRELFAGLFEEAERSVHSQASKLLKSLEGQLPNRTLEQKIEFLHGLSGSLEPHYVPARGDDDTPCPEC